MHVYNIKTDPNNNNNKKTIRSKPFYNCNCLIFLIYMTLPKGYGLNSAGQVVQITKEEQARIDFEKSLSLELALCLDILSRKTDPIMNRLIKVLLANRTITTEQFVKDIIQYEPIVNEPDLKYGTYKIQQQPEIVTTTTGSNNNNSSSTDNNNQ